MARGKRILSLREIDALEDPDGRRQAMLDRLDEDRTIALGVERVINAGQGKQPLRQPAPDVTAAIQADREACVLLRIQPVAKPNLTGLAQFEPKPKLEAVK